MISKRGFCSNSKLLLFNLFITLLLKKVGREERRGEGGKETFLLTLFFSSFSPFFFLDVPLWRVEEEANTLKTLTIDDVDETNWAPNWEEMFVTVFILLFSFLLIFFFFFDIFLLMFFFFFFFFFFSNHQQF